MALDSNSLAMRDACFVDMLRLIKNCAKDAAEYPNLTGAQALASLYDSVEQQGPEGFGLSPSADLPTCPPAVSSDTRHAAVRKVIAEF